LNIVHAVEFSRIGHTPPPHRKALHNESDRSSFVEAEALDLSYMPRPVRLIGTEVPIAPVATRLT
jgi:hypothetical protein